jgi:Coenzyme PQQ synthesis protein D (PqqD)
MAHYSTSVPMLVSRQFDDEIVLANYENGLYYSLTGAGADIWLALKAGCTAEDIIAAFSARYPQFIGVVAAAVPAFIDQLLAEGIVTRLGESPPRQEWSPMGIGAFLQPVCERFDDLRDLLLLDPIHEVGEGGWPLRSDDAR